jgi:uncharacterized protein
MAYVPRKLFLNLAVKDLAKAKHFFSALGFTFNPQFTDDNAACMILSEESFVMLLTEPYFRGFTTKQLCDTSTHTEGLCGFSCTSREEVDTIVAAALANGGSVAGEPQDHGFMYGRGFYDLDGHHWEVIWMNPAHVQG